MCAIKYLRSKLEQRDGARSATPIGDSKSTRDLLTRIGAAAAEEEAAGSDGTKQQLASSQTEVLSLKEKVEELEKEKSRLVEEIQKLKASGGKVQEASAGASALLVLSYCAAQCRVPTVSWYQCYL